MMWEASPTPMMWEASPTPIEEGVIIVEGLSRTTRLVGILVNLLAFLYLITSAVVTINAFVWLPTFPAFWYGMQRVIYWPWQPYFDLAYAALGRSSISYQVYAVVTRAPFLVGPLVIIGLTVRRLVGRGNVVQPRVETHLWKGDDSLVGERETRIILALGMMVALTLLYLLSPAFRTQIQRALALLAEADIEQVKEYLLGFGVWAPVVSGSLMVLQALLVPLPAMVLTLVNGLLFGTIGGALLSWSSAMVGAIVCYAISRLFGRPVVERLVGGRSLDITDRFFQRYGRHAVLIARLIPVVSFDVVSYAAGLTSIGLWEFALTTGIGQLPATLVYSFLGQHMTRAARWGLWIILGVLALGTLGFALKARFEESLLSESQ